MFNILCFRPSELHNLFRITFRQKADNSYQIALDLENWIFIQNHILAESRQFLSDLQSTLDIEFSSI